MSDKNGVYKPTKDSYFSFTHIKNAQEEFMRLHKEHNDNIPVWKEDLKHDPDMYIFMNVPYRCELVIECWSCNVKVRIYEKV